MRALIETHKLLKNAQSASSYFAHLGIFILEVLLTSLVFLSVIISLVAGIEIVVGELMTVPLMVSLLSVTTCIFEVALFSCVIKRSQKEQCG